MRNKTTTKRVFPSLLILLVGSVPVAVADFIGMVDVDKPTGVPTTYNKWGDFTNIDNNWNNTCWQAVSASMLNYVGFGGTQAIYNWFQAPAHYGNTGTATHFTWRDAMNDFIKNSGFTSPSGPYYARAKSAPTDNWAEAMIANSPIGLATTCGGNYSGRHSIAYSGFHDVHDWSWIADPDSDFRSETLPVPPVYMDWSLFNDVASTSYNWMLERIWTDGQHLTFDVEGAVYLVPDPASLTLGLIGLGYASWRLRRRKTLR